MNRAAASHTPDWRLPRGVSRGLWDYIRAPHIADQYDEYFAYNDLFEFDEAIVARHFTKPGRIIDLGCGTGRLLVPFARRGFPGVGVDLSQHMLDIVREKASLENLPISCVLANITELDCLADQAADYAMCMFSTLGMIRGRENRHQVLRHARRMLKPEGVFVLHVHNRWYNLFDPQGRRWLLQNTVSSAFREDVERGDKMYDYRGIPNMILHTFSLGELTADLNSAGFAIRECVTLDTTRHRPLRRPWLLPRIRANGWIVVCEALPST